ncbi:MAG: PHB depolymerase family esterase [Verrucomicrobiota bacterium]
MNIPGNVRLGPLRKRRRVVFALLLCGLLLAAGLALMVTDHPSSSLDRTDQLLEAARQRADALLSRPELSAYRGWIKYLRLRAEREISGAGVTNNRSAPNVIRFAGWVRQIEANPNILGTLRGVQEWAYESPADDSGQPFMLNIPTDYAPARPAALLVNLHGGQGDHKTPSGAYLYSPLRSVWVNLFGSRQQYSHPMAPHQGMFELAVMLRARRAGSGGLDEADVLQAIEYVETHWHIDTNRIHLAGLSGGGSKVALLGADYPHLFASGEIDAGPLLMRPMNNLLTLPVYAIHSRDDPLAPIITSRGPLARLRELGGAVIFDETDGFGHGVDDYKAGHQRAAVWRQQRVRPDSRTVRRLDFTALSGAAPRAWWAEIAEWGPASRPAHFALTAGTNNLLRAELSNITRLKLRIAESPFDRNQPLRVSVNGAEPFEVPASLPESLVLVSGPEGWQAETNSEWPSFRLHTPGGPMLLYDGSPLLIVYGTRGDTNLCAAMRAAAEAASKSPNPSWAFDTNPVDGEGVPYSHILYGGLKTKADRDVTDADVQKCHLVLIGTAEQNAIVARLASRLPVQRTAGRIRCSDGFELDETNRTTALVYYNPLAPQGLIFWVASDEAKGYAAPARFIFGPADFVVAESGKGVLVVRRCFDSRWDWDPARSASPLMPDNAIIGRGAGLACARAMQQATHADFAFKFADTNTAPWFMAGTTRLADVLPYSGYDPACLMELTGTQLLELESRLNAPPKKVSLKPLFPDPDLLKLVYPAINPAKVEPERKYRMAILLSDLHGFGKTFRLDPPSFRMTDLEAADILDHFFLSKE